MNELKHISTDCAHAGEEPLGSGSTPSVMPIHQTSVYDFPDLEQVDEIWLVITGSWETENVLFFAELCPNVMDRRLMLDLNTSVTMALGA